MSQLGRIGGQVLTDDLLRAGVDLAFENDLLYIDVNNNKIGINQSPPIYDLDVNSAIKTTVLTITNQATIDGITFTAPYTIGSTVAPIEIFIGGSTLYHDRLTTSSLEFDDNFIRSFSNSNIILDPSGSGTTELYARTNITGTLGVSGNVELPGDLRVDGRLIVGDSPGDTVTIAPDLTQDLIPGSGGLYDLGSSLKRWRNGYVNSSDISSGFAAGNIIVSAPSAISVAAGNISINIAGSSPIAEFTGDIQTSGIRIDGNLIESFTNQSIRFNPSGSGSINLEANTSITGNLGVSGNIAISGNLSKQGSIFLGDDRFDGEGSLTENDTITINTDFAQSLILGEDLTYNLGIDRFDSTPRRWSQAYIPDWSNISTGDWPGSGLRPQIAIVSDQMRIDGVTNKISGIQSNEDIVLSSAAGAVYIEQTKWQDSDITNLLDTSLIIRGTGISYTQFVGTNAVVVPSGTTAEQRTSPELGETRWNTEVGYLECFDGTVWTISTGGGDEVTQVIMEDFGHAYTLMLG